MRIGIDARLAFGDPTGIGSYSRRLIEALARADAGNEYLLYVDREPEAVEAGAEVGDRRGREGLDPRAGELAHKQILSRRAWDVGGRGAARADATGETVSGAGRRRSRPRGCRPTGPPTPSGR